MHEGETLTKNVKRLRWKWFYPSLHFTLTTFCVEMWWPNSEHAGLQVKGSRSETWLCHFVVLLIKTV